MAKAICQLLVQRVSSSLDTGEKSRGLSQMEYIQCQHSILNPAQEDINSRYRLYTDTCAEFSGQLEPSARLEGIILTGRVARPPQPNKLEVDGVALL